MGNTKHTPGPWAVDGFNTVAVIAQMPHTIGSNYPEYQHVCTCDYGYTEPEINVNLNKANAKLIAAAPDLLEALNKMLDFYWEGYSDPKKAMEKFAKDNPNSATATTLAAIKKATE